MKTPCRRRCHNCGNEADHADHITPDVCCAKCGSQDTRLIRQKPTTMRNHDGSITLPKDVADKLIHALKWRGWAELGRTDSFVSSMDEFYKAFVEHTGLEVEQFT